MMAAGRGLALPYVGLDLTAGGRPSDLAALDLPGARVAFAVATTDAEIEAQLHRLGAQVVAIDSPLGLPAGLCCLEASCPCQPTGGTGRSAERALAERGISCFWTTKRTIIKPMIYRAIRLRQRLRDLGCTVLEVYPYATKRILLGFKPPPKNTLQGQAAVKELAARQLPDCPWPASWSPTHDQLDALLCAITARLYALGGTEALGDPDEVQIVVPAAATS